MKVLVVHNRYFERGGEDVVVENTIRLLRKFDHEVIIYEHSNHEIEQFSFLEKIKLAISKVVWSKKTYQEVRKLIQKEKPDIVHTHNIFVLISPSVYYACQDESVPVVHTFHNYRFLCANGSLFRNGHVCLDCLKGNYGSALVHRCWKDSFIITFIFMRMLRIHFRRKTFQDKVDAYIALTDFGKELFVRGGIPRHKIHVCSNFVDVKEEKRQNFENFAIFAGRLVDHKGVYTLIEAFKKNSTHKLVLIGDGPAYKELEEKTAAMSNVKLLGRLSYKDTMDYLKKAAFLIFPSEWYEGAPLTVIESLAYGVPVLIGDIAFKGEGIQESGSGLEFKTGNSDDLAEKIKYLMNNRNILIQMGERARELYEARHTPEKNYNTLMQIYNKLCSRSREDYV